MNKERGASMKNRRERTFLKGLCKGHIQDLIEEVGWTPIQCAMVRKRYIEFKSVPRICMETCQASTTYNRNFDDVCKKLRSYMLTVDNLELLKLYNTQT